MYIRRIPHEITKYRRIRTMAHECRSTLLKLFDTVVKRLAYVLHPSDGRGLFYEYCAQKSSEGRLARKMVNILRKLRKGSVEKRVVRACLFSSIQGRVLYDMMTNNPKAMDMEIGEIQSAMRTESDNEDGDTFGDGEHPGEEDNGSGSNMEEPRTALQAGNRTEDRDRNCNGMRPTGVSDPGAEGIRKNLSGGFQRLQKTSRTDWLTLVATGALSTETKRRRHFEDDILVRMLCFLFRADNVQLLSWGTKRVMYNGEIHRFPAVIRRTSGEGLWRRYNREMGIRNNVDRVGRTVFRSIVSYLTKGQLEARTCIDYYQDSLVNENVKLLKEIIKKECDPSMDHSLVLKRLDAITGFLKCNYANHLQYHSSDRSLHVAFVSAFHAW